MTTAKRTEDEYGSRHYFYPPTGEPVVSSTTVNSATEGKPWLPPWSAAIAAGWSVDHLQLLADTLAKDGRDAAVDLAKKQSEIIRDTKRDAGGYVHDVIEKLIYWAWSGAQGATIPLPILPEHLEKADYDDEKLTDVVDWMITGFCNFVADFQPEFHAAEMTVFNMDLGYAGTLDSIVGLTGYVISEAERFAAAPRNRLTLCLDVKTGKHLSVTWREQIASYRHAREALLRLDDLIPMPATDAGVVLHLRPEHPRGYRLMLVSAENDAKAWATFQNSLNMYLDRAASKPKPGKVVYPLRPDGTMPQPRIADLDGEGYGRAISPLVKTMGAGADIEQLAAMTAAQCRQIRGVGPKVLDVIRLLLADHGLHLHGEIPTTARKAA